MEHEIEKLIQSLDSKTLELLPCFYDGPELIQFRIGFKEGPQILYKFLRNDDYNLSLRDEKNRIFNYVIKVGSGMFDNCKNICQHIKELCENDDYIKNRKKNIEIMISNLISLLKLVFG